MVHVVNGMVHVPGDDTQYWVDPRRITYLECRQEDNHGPVSRLRIFVDFQPGPFEIQGADPDAMVDEISQAMRLVTVETA